MQPNLKELPSYDGPPKYLTQRDPPLEIPIEVVKALFFALDTDMDDRVSIEELATFVEQQQIPFSEENVVEMFKEATRGRAIIHDK